MKLDKRDKRALSDVRMGRAREFYQDASALDDEKRYRSSVNRAYYSALNAVRSLLILEGADPGSHEGAVTLLSLRFVKTGMLPAGVVKRPKTLLSRRTDVDYGDFDAIHAAEAEDSLKSAAYVIETVRDLTSGKTVIPSNSFFSIIKSKVMSAKKQFKCHCHFIL